MESANERDYQRRVGAASSMRFLPGTAVEIIREVRLPEPPRYALFDFDGTLSLIREGWQDIMIPMLVGELQKTATGESEAALTALVKNFVTELTGKQTIYQMLRLAEEITARGGTPDDPVAYKHVYHDRLMQRIQQRRDALRTGRMPAREMLVPGAVEALEALRRIGVVCYLASGTDEVYVREEAELLGLNRFFGEHIYGAIDDLASFSKQMVIQRILTENAVDGIRLLAFGDGYVEIDDVKRAGGIAVAVASDEAGRSGKPDAWKRDRLIGVGADVVIPDFRDYAALFDYLWNPSHAVPTIRPQ